MAVGTAASPPAPSDGQLLARFAGGDRDALDELFQRYRLLAYRVAYRLLGNEADALDAVQDGFVKALTHLPSFRGAARSRPGCCGWSATPRWTLAGAAPARRA